MLTFCEEMEAVKKFVYVGSRVNVGGDVSDKINLRIRKARSAYVKLDYLWHHHDVSLTVKYWVYNT